MYDRHQRKLAQRKWCTLVSHLAREPLPVNSLQRKLTIYLSAPPGDGLRSAREYFQEYIKPVLVAAALDWEVVDGRREGDVRAGMAERVRKLRTKQGEVGHAEVEEDAEAMVDQTRRRTGIQDWDGVKGDIVIGRHTWKEYIRGLHEGWLGPLDPPPTPESSAPSPSSDAPLPDPISVTDTSPPPDDLQTAQDDPSPASPLPETPTAEDKTIDNEKKKEKEKPKPTTPTPSYLPTSAYTTSSLPPTIPPTFEPSSPLPFPHILGFFNTPICIYRFLTRRHLADAIGRQTAAVVLAAYRPYEQTSSFSSSIDPDSPSSTNADGGVVESGTTSEQQHVLAEEEPEWHKSARKRKDGEGERVWLDDVVVDPRIGERMRRFELAPADEERAKRIAEGKEGVLGQPVVEEESVLNSLLARVGWGTKEEGVKPGWVQGEEGSEEP